MDILIVDDDAILLRTLKRHLLRTLSCSVTCADGGVAGLKAIRAATYDIVLTDFNMPILDGAAVLAEARKGLPTAARIMMSAGDVSDHTVDADAVISKPFRISHLVELIEQLLSSRRGHSD